MTKRQNYSREFKIEAVKMVTEQGLSIKEVADDLGVHQNTLRTWKQQLAKDAQNAFPGNGKQTLQELEMRKLREENRKLRMERDILKKATAFFASPRSLCLRGASFVGCGRAGFFVFFGVPFPAANARPKKRTAGKTGKVGCAASYIPYFSQDHRLAPKIIR